MAITTATLRESVAEHLRIKSADMDLEAEDAAKIDRYIQMVTDAERQKGLIWWVDNAIPEEARMAMVLMVSSLCAASYGKAGQGYEPGYQDGKIILASLKPSAVIETVPADYF